MLIMDVADCSQEYISGGSFEFVHILIHFYSVITVMYLFGWVWTHKTPNNTPKMMILLTFKDC